MTLDPCNAVLGVKQMYEADRRAMASGIPGATLMEHAGQAVAAGVIARWQARPVVVLCGPGNNGGDGFVAARLLDEAGWPVKVALLGKREELSGDAGAMAARWRGPVSAMGPGALEGAALVIDALFGAGLTRDVVGVAAETLRMIKVPCIAVDIPSGVDGDTGDVRGVAANACLTMTFCRSKPGHLLMPGRSFCGELVISDIGISDDIVASLRPALFRNGPEAWNRTFPWPRPSAHKYARGHLVVAGGNLASSGASRLAARAGLRAGAGLVTVAAPPSALLVHAMHLTAVMVRPDPDPSSFAAMLAEPRVAAAVLGPGQGLGKATRDRVAAALATGKPLVLDADALSEFAEEPETLFDMLHDKCVLTPHDGEFRRLFDFAGTRLDRARAAASRCGAVVLLKGPDTIIAFPDGTAVINDNAPPELATAGSGDVLAGFIGGLLAQGVSAGMAASIGAWLHGACGARCGPGLISEDLTEALPAVLRELRNVGA